MRFDFVERRLSRAFSVYIRVVATNPWPFLIGPLVLSALLSTGLVWHSDALLKDDLSLYTPANARARQELRQLETLFPINDSDPYFASRRYDLKRMGYIIVTAARNNADVLDPMTLESAMRLWTAVRDLRVSGRSYVSLCVKWPLPHYFVVDLARAAVAAERGGIPPVDDSNDDEENIGGTASTDSSAKSPINEFCVSNPIVELLKSVLAADGRKEVGNADAPRNNSSLRYGPTSAAALRRRRDVAERLSDRLSAFLASNAISKSDLGVAAAQLLGGVTRDARTRRIVGAKAIMLPYALRHSTRAEDTLAERWELALAETLRGFRSPTIRVAVWTDETLNAESERDREQLKRALLPGFAAVSLYTLAVCCAASSRRRAHPLLAIGAVACAAMSVVSAAGLLLHGGFPTTSIVYAMPFIVFSIGVDNAFILLAAWRAADPALALRDRMATTFGDAAVSITITTLTDLISFGVGCTTPYPSVQLFCVYALVAVAFTYAYQLTFLAAVMYWSCEAETGGSDGGNNESDKRTLPRQLLTTVADGAASSDDADKIANALIARLRGDPFSLPLSAAGWAIEGGSRHIVGRTNDSPSDDSDSFRRSFLENHALACFFYTCYADALLCVYTRAYILLAYVAYLAFALYGTTRVQIGLEPYELLPYDSHGRLAIEMANKYFSENGGGSLHVWSHNLSAVEFGPHRRLWEILEADCRLFEHTEFTADADSWLRVFRRTVGGRRIDEEMDFLRRLRDFLDDPRHEPFRRDLVFHASTGRLEASRFLVRLKRVDFSVQPRAMDLFRQIADESASLPTRVYADFFLFAEQYHSVLPATLWSIAVAAAAVTVASLVLIPEPTAAAWALLTILSINVGVLGFMACVSIRLDLISMVTIVMSVGFCVDFAAHLSYNFAKQPQNDRRPDSRLRRTLYAVGTPILQSASSTVVGVAFMCAAESHVFCSFLKTILLVVGLGLLHGLVVLPALLVTAEELTQLVNSWTGSSCMC